jgi:hypothetical protein
MYIINVHVHYCFYFQILIKLEFSKQIFKKYSNIKFHENPSSGSQVVPCGRTDRQTDMTKPIVTFRNFANEPKTKSPKYIFCFCACLNVFKIQLLI